MIEDQETQTVRQQQPVQHAVITLLGAIQSALRPISRYGIMVRLTTCACHPIPDPSLLLEQLVQDELLSYGQPTAAAQGTYTLTERGQTYLERYRDLVTH